MFYLGEIVLGVYYMFSIEWWECRLLFIDGSGRERKIVLFYWVSRLYFVFIVGRVKELGCLEG